MIRNVFKVSAISLIFLLIMSFVVQDQADKSTRMAWFKDAKLGIFIHWGIYSVQGVSESWSFYNGHMSHEDYMSQMKGFTAKNWDPKQWVDLIRESGAKYTVLTAKHHDGVALWPTKQNSRNVVEASPGARDLIQAFTDEVKEQGLKLGLYFSLLDWSHKNYPNFTRKQKRYTQDTLRWNKFVEFNFAQIKEILAYKPDLLWFDGDWEQTAEAWRASDIRDTILKSNPNIIINSRLKTYGDYATPELAVPIDRPKNPYWELCMTMNESWGYQPKDTAYKSVNQVIGILVECLHKGGNLLLDIGPKADGSIPKEQVALLKGLGRWTKKHAEAIYGSRAGIDSKYFNNGLSALSKDQKTLYLFVESKPTGPILLKGLNNKVKNIRVVGSSEQPSWELLSKPSWSKKPGLLYISIPEKALDKDVTVLALELEGEVDMF